MHEYALPTTGGGSGYRQQQQLQQLQQEYAHEYSQEYTPPSRAGRSNDYTPGDYGGDYAADYAGGDYANEYQTEYQQPHVNGPPPPLPSRRGNSHQTRLAGTTPSSAIMAANPQLTPVVLPSFPTSLRAGSGATYSPYSPSRFHIDKRCQHRCSWKCCSLALILLCVVLTGMLAYFGAVGSMRPGLDPSGCSINVQDNKDAVRDEASLGLAPSQTSPTEESLPTSTAVQYASASSRAPADTPDRPPDLPSIQQQQQQQQQQPPLQPLQPAVPPLTAAGVAVGGWPAVVEMRELGVPHSATIPALQFWNSEFRNKQPAFIRFNFTIPWGANFAVYGRRNVGPSVTQHDFVEFIKAGRLDHRARRSLDHVAAFVSSHSYYGDHEYPDDDDVAEDVDLNAVSFMAPPFNDSKARHVWTMDQARNSQATPPPPPPPPPMRRRRGVVAGLPLGADPMTATSTSSVAGGMGRSMRVNVSLLQYLDTGRWFLSVYNDDLRPQEVTLVVTEAEGVSTTCPNDCSGHGSCYLGKCDCIDGYEGIDCSKSVCPVLCSNHGKYGGGLCHCEGGWKGAECDVPARDCQVADCSGRGRCNAGRCECQPGWKGAGCELVDCEDPNCSGHGSCVEGRCYCKAGWQGPSCGLLDQQVYQCLPGCSDHGTYDLESGACVCDAYWTGPDCSQPLCGLDCGPHGVCDEGRCKCRPGWTGERCDQLPCDTRCTEHGQCKNGTCVCSQGWNGRHCTLPGCLNGCNRQGTCMLEDGEYRCVCGEGWAGRDCGIRLETECNDKKDNDNDGMMDCSDSECCLSEICLSHIMCLSSKNPVEVLLRKQPPLVTASFYQRVKFLIEENSVQSYAHTESYTERRVSVMRGQVVTPQGLGIYGVRVSVDKDARLGFTLTRAGGWFDMLVNGGGAVTLQFLRTPFQTTTRTVFVPWNQIVVLAPVVLPLAGDTASPRDRDAAAAAALGFEMPVSSLSLFAGVEDGPGPGPGPCEAHDHTLLKPVVVSTWMPEKVGGLSGRSLVFAETQILQEAIRIPGSDLFLQYQSSQAPGYLSTVLMRLTQDRVPATLTHVHVTVQIEGSVHTKTYEADPNLTHVFAWNKRNVYKQKVYGVAQAKVSVGYKHSTCRNIIWETQTATLQGFDVDISDIGGWGLSIHHHYNFHEGILQKGDGSTLHLKRYPRTIKVVVGTGLQRSLQCEDCNGVARDARLLTPVALASGPDGSLYVGDFNLIRRVTPDGNIYTVLQLSATQVSHQYYLSVSPADGHLYVSDTERHQILRVLQLGPNIEDPRINSEPAVGSGDRCVPGDENHCGDEGPALAARLAHPKGLVIAADKTMYIADGTNIRAVDPKGIIHTLVGHHGHHNLWTPIPCHGAIPAAQAQLQWPTGLALSPLDGSLHFIDDRLVMKLTSDRKVKVVAGMPLHCHAPTCAAKEQPEQPPAPQAQPKDPKAKDDKPKAPKAPKQPKQDDRKKQEELESEEGSEATSTVLGSILSIAFSPNGELFIAEADSRKVNAIRVVDSAGRMSDFAGRPQTQEAFPAHGCDCTSNNASWPGGPGGPGMGTTAGPAGIAGATAAGLLGCVCGPQLDDPAAGMGTGKDSRETLLSSNAKFTSISAMVVAPDGVLHVADQGSLHVLALEHYLPTHDENGEFRIPFPPTGEVYVFNRYGQHVATRDLTSGNTRYTFLYSKNTSFGKLSTVTDAAGNKILFLRDYSNVVSTIENTQDHKSDLKISGIGFLEKFSEPGRSEIDLHYDSNTGLLTSRADAKGAGGRTSMYRYDELGRVTQVILATGETIDLRSRISLDDGLAVEVHAPQAAIALASGTAGASPQQQRGLAPHNEKQPVTLRMAGRGARRMVISDGLHSSEAASYRNGSLTLRGPWAMTSWGGELACAARRRHPLLELALPVEAEMLPMWSDQVVAASPGVAPNSVAWSYNIVGDAGSSQHKLHQDLWVNHSRVLAMEYDQATRRQTFIDREGQPLLTVALDHEGLPMSWTPSGGKAGVNISYDRFRRVDSWRWGDQQEKYSYDRKGLLSEVSTPQDGAMAFTYDELNVPTVITLPSKRRFEFRYDADGGLRHITLPSGTHHSLSVQPSLGFLRATYTAPGATRPYLQHFSYSGLLLQTVYPGDGARVIYKYTSAGKLAEVLHGDGRTRVSYSPQTALPTSVQHSERDLDYRWDYGYSGGLLAEERIEFGPKTGLNNAKISYEFDDNMRVVSVAGRVGGQALPEHGLAYSPRTGAATQIGQFQVQRVNGNETRVGDGTAIFTRFTNRMMQEVQVAVTIHNMEAFRMEFSYDSRGRISQTRTYTRNVGVNMYTNVKNFTWDADGQLAGVAAQEPWSFEYDPNGNMLSLTYRGNTIPMEYNQMDRVVKFGEGVYRYDSRGLVTQNAREERFHYNAKGLLVRANKRGRFDVRYYYDHLDRLSVRKDNYGNVTQFFYTNHKRPSEVTQIYSPRDGKLMSLTYDDRGHLVFAQVYRHKYYIATDQCGTPVMVFNQYGEGIREIMRSPYGHIVYDSNPYLYLPIDFCGGLLDQVVSLVHMPGGKVYDPLIGQLMGPAWEDVPARLSKPTHLNLYRFNGNDPINMRLQHNHLTDHRSWLAALGYDLPNLAPQLYPSVEDSTLPRLLSPLSPFASPAPLTVSPARPSMAVGAQDGPPLSVVSGFLSHVSERLLSDRLSVSGWPSAASNLAVDAKGTKGAWPPNNPLQTFRIGSAFEPPFGRGIIVSRTAQGQAVINSVPSANPIYRDVFTSVFNGSYMLDVLLLVHGASQDTLFFVQPRVERAGEDKAQLKRLGGSVNTTFHEKTGDKEKVMDLKIHTQTAVINLRYGTTPEKEKQRILHHAKTSAVRKAWHREQEAIRNGYAGSGSGLASGVDWSASEQDEILKTGQAAAYEGEFIHDIFRYPELAEDPYNVRFVKKNAGDEPGASAKRKRSASDSAPVASASSSASADLWWRPCSEPSC